MPLNFYLLMRIMREKKYQGGYMFNSLHKYVATHFFPEKNNQQGKIKEPVKPNNNTSYFNGIGGKIKKAFIFGGIFFIGGIMVYLKTREKTNNLSQQNSLSSVNPNKYSGNNDPITVNDNEFSTFNSINPTIEHSGFTTRKLLEIIDKNGREEGEGKENYWSNSNDGEYEDENIEDKNYEESKGVNTKQISNKQLTKNIRRNLKSIEPISKKDYYGGQEFPINLYNYQSRYPTVTRLNDGGFLVVRSGEGQGDSSGVFAKRFDTKANAVGPEFLVNTNTTLTQWAPLAANLTNGGFVIVWPSNHKDPEKKWDAFGRLYNTAGEAIGQEFEINTYITDDQGDPSVGGLDNGNFLVAWHSKGQNDSAIYHNVYGQFFDSLANKIGEEFLVNSYINDHQTFPIVVGLNNGTAIITWMSGTQDEPSSYGVYGQMVNFMDGKIGEEFRVNNYTINHQDRPTADRLSNSGFGIAWHSMEQDGDKYGIYFQLYDSNANRVGGEIQANTYTEGDQAYPSFASLSNGEFVIAWMGEKNGTIGYDVYGRRFSANGIPLGKEFLISSDASSQEHPAVTGLSGGGFVVTWVNMGQNKGVYVRISAPWLITNNLYLNATEDSTVQLTYPQSLNAGSIWADNATLTYIISNLENGYFYNINNPTKSIYNFTQQQLIYNEIYFQYNGSNVNQRPGYAVSVIDSDGLETSAYTANVTFHGKPESPELPSLPIDIIVAISIVSVAGFGAAACLALCIIASMVYVKKTKDSKNGGKCKDGIELYKTTPESKSKSKSTYVVFDNSEISQGQLEKSVNLGLNKKIKSTLEFCNQIPIKRFLCLMSKKPEKRQPATVYVYHLEKDKRSWWICSKSIDKSSKISDRKITNFLKKTTKDKNAKKGSYEFKPRVLDEIKNTLKNNELYKKHIKSIDILVLSKKIGGGGSGTIWLGKWQREKIAYKILDEANISGVNMDGFIQELSLLLRLQHPNIIKFYGITIKQNRIGIVMEYLPNSLMQLIKDKKVVIDGEEIKLTWLIKLEIIRGLTLALKYMHHNKDIAHRDVKPDNVLLKKGKNNLLVPIIIDFGLSKQIRNKEGTTLAIGTGFYMAPELTVIQKKNSKEIDVKKTDVFSAFMTIIELVNEEPLYRDYRNRVNGYAIASSIQMKELAPEKIKGNKCPKEFLEYINNNIFPREPNNRPAMAEFSEWLEDNKKILEGFNEPETKSSKAITKGNIKKHVKPLPKPPVPTALKKKPNERGKNLRM